MNRAYSPSHMKPGAVHARGLALLASNDEPELTADMVRSMVATKWPGLLDSPLGQAMHGASAMAQLESSDADAAIAEHEELICVSCNGSGEGQYEGTRCRSCGGSGTERMERDEPDWDAIRKERIERELIEGARHG